MKSLVVELSLMLLVALLAVGLVEYSLIAPESAPLEPPSPVGPSLDQKTQPHQTYPDMLLVTFTLYPDRPPVIDQVKHLAEGRLTTPPPGDNRLKLIGPEGQVLYSLSFTADFYLLDGPTKPLDKLSYTYVLPYTPEVVKVALSTPQGEVIATVPAAESN